MGTKGARGKVAGVEAAAALERRWQPLGVSSRAMFGGHGLFKDDVMFAIVDSEGRLYLRADASTAMAFEQPAPRSTRACPTGKCRQPVRADDEQLREWAATAAEVAIRGRR